MASKSISSRWWKVDRSTGEKVKTSSYGVGSEWRARYRDAAGKEHNKSFRRKVDAQRWLDEVTTSIVTGTYVDPKAGRVTFSQWFKLWCSRQAWEPSTQESATTVARSVTFGDVEMRNLRASHIQGWVKSMSDRSLALGTIKLRFNYVRMSLLAAVDEPVIPKDPSAKVRLPTGAKKSTTKVRSSEIPTAVQVGEALDAAPDYFMPFVAVCAFAGLRLGEAAGLRVVDVDFLGRVIRVEQQVQGTTRANTRVVPPKYGSRREVYVPEELTTMLARHVETIGTRDGLLFSNGPEMWNRMSAGEQWRQIRSSVDGLEGFTLHSLRHFFASGLISAGCDVVTVQRALGHSSPSITLDVYSHLWPKAEDRTRSAATGLMESVFGAAAANVRPTGPSAL